MPVEPRRAFHRELDRLDIAVTSLLGLIPDAVHQATTALLDGNPQLAAEVVQAGQLVEDLYGDVETTIEGVMARQAPVARDLRFLLCCVRLLPQLRETLELVGRIAAPEVVDVADRLDVRGRALTSSMGERSADMWSAVDGMWRGREDAGPEGLRGREDALADVHAALAAEVAAGGLDLDVAIEMTVVTLAYNRLAQLASSAARLVGALSAVHPA